MKKSIFLLFASFLVNQTVLPQNNTNLGYDAGEGGQFNVSIGDYSGNHVTGARNVFVGFRSGNYPLTGNDNTFLGSNTGYYNTSGGNNTFIGSAAGYRNEGSLHNTFIGARAGQNNTGHQNTFVGSYSGYNNTAGSRNIFIGRSSGYSNTNGNSNIFMGLFAGYSNTYGGRNINIGEQAGYGNISGNQNCIVGHQAAYYNTTGSQNCIFGFQAGYNNNHNRNSIFGYEAGSHAAGYNNSIFGFQAGFNNGGVGNVYIGSQAGYENSSRLTVGNVFIGDKSGYNNLTTNNTIVGAEAGLEGLGGDGWNTYLGYRSGYTGQGYGNVFLGPNSGYQNSNGRLNVFVGLRAGENSLRTTGNTFVGAFAGFRSVEGDSNVFIGYQAGQEIQESNRLYIANKAEGNPLIYGDFVKENIALGATDAGSYRLYVSGNAYTTGTWTSSDERFKHNVESVIEALDKVRNLKGHTFTYSDSIQFKDRQFNPGLNYGFIAQEVKEVIPELIRDDPDGYLCLNYDGIVPVLVEALKELDSQFNQQINLLNTQIAELQQQLDQQAVSSKSGSIDGISIPGMASALYQNVPNPFNEETRLQYYVAGGSSDAAIYVYDLQGKQQLVYNNLNSGSGEVIIHAQELSPGLYNYCLLANNTIIDIKKLVVTE